MKKLINEASENYRDFKHPNINSKKLTYTEFAPQLEKLKALNFLTVKQIGVSIERRPIHSIRFGKGPKKIILWTQMHGNEATATRALFDFFSLLQSSGFSELRNQLSNKIELIAIPMLNPDGAERYQRRTALDIDPNRDAVRQQTPEIQTLFSIIEAEKPDWCFNMHDQRNLFNVSGENTPATISFLSPSTNDKTHFTTNQKEAMQLIDCLTSDFAKKASVGIARFTHEFYPTATGDNIQKMGFRTVLVESGGFRGDSNRNVSREVCFNAIVNACYLIASDSWNKGAVDNYLKIPENDTKLFDVLVKNVMLNNSKRTLVDIGVEYSETLNSSGQVVVTSIIKDLGDLSHYFGYQEIDAKGGQLTTTISLGLEANFEIEFENKPTILVRNGCMK